MTTFNWLHLTDLHLGMAEQIPFLPVIKDRFFEDLKPLHEKCGPWDLVLFTGDLTQRGSREDFQKADEFLAKLWDLLRELGSTPALLAVPGNHDLVRPSPREPEVKLLRNWINDSELQTEFWTDPKSPYHDTVRAAFANYVEWWDRLPQKPPTQSGFLPGDFSAVIQKEGATLGVVGLNTTFLQLTDGDYRGKLALDPRQFQSVCDGNGPEWVKKHNTSLLLTHQPPDWLTPESQQHLHAEIAGYNFFAAHLFGHMHEARYESVTQGGASTLRSCQGTSLFGLEYFGEGKKQDRRHGYSAGRIELIREKGSLVQWPRQAYRPGGQWHFAADSVDFILTDEGTKPEEFPLLRTIIGAPIDAPPQYAGPGSDLAATVIVSTSHVEVVEGQAEMLRVFPDDIPNEEQTHAEEVARPKNASEPVQDSPKALTATAAGPFPNRWAVLVGINDYQQFTPLRYCRQDVIALANVLRESVGFQKVFEIHEQSPHKPDRESILLHLADIRDSGDVKPDDLFLFYFSGHGISEGGKDYLLPIGARPRDVKTLGIRVQDLAESLKAIGCKNTVMFIDACRDAIQGAKGTVSIGEESKGLISEAGIIAFFSCDPKDRSYEIEPLEHGSFTFALLKAIEEGATTVSEVDNYLKENVPQINAKFNKPAQQPYAVTETPEQGDLPIFFNPNRIQQSGGEFDPFIDKLARLFGAGSIEEDDFVKALEFIDQMKSKKQFDRIEKIKLSAIKGLCDGRWGLETFLRVWNSVDLESRRPVAPQIRKLPRLN